MTTENANSVEQTVTAAEKSIAAEKTIAAAGIEAAEATRIKEPEGFANGLIGSILSWAAIGLFYLTCIILPLVGQAGKATPYKGANFATFLIVVFLALGVSVAALLSRLARRKTVGGGLPWIQVGLVLVNVLILLMLFTKRLGV